jgi:hypothetical protein
MRFRHWRRKRHYLALKGASTRPEGYAEKTDDTQRRLRADNMAQFRGADDRSSKT